MMEPEALEPSQYREVEAGFQAPLSPHFHRCALSALDGTDLCH